MLFNSFHFLIFFTIVATTYFLIPHKIRWILLLVASYIFYMAWRPELIILIVFSTAINYVLSNKIYNSKAQKKKKNLLILSIAINFGLLFIFKYLVFINNSFQTFFATMGVYYPVKEFDIVLPMGISFYTFQAASYTIDVYKGIIKPVKSYGKFSLFITFFPQLVAGPIERSKNLLPQFYQKHSFNLDRVILGFKIMAWGFFKKVVIADRVAVAVNTVFNNVTYHSGLTYILAITLFTFQIYCDFSGYSDIAMGCAKVLGFNLMDNFKRPFLSKSIKEFWRRWHISLSTWFMDYVYIPLGGNRSGKAMQYRNLMITFLASGLWHGANWTFLLWGGLHGAFIVLEDITHEFTVRVKKALGFQQIKGVTAVSNFFSTVITFGLVVFSFIAFRANTMEEFIYVVKHLFWGVRQWGEPLYLYQSINALGLSFYELLVAGVAILILIIVEIFCGEDLHQTLMKTNGVFRTAIYGALITIILTTGVFYNAGAFIYFQF